MLLCSKRLLSAAIALVPASPVFAQQDLCGPADKVMPMMAANHYAERPVFEGMSGTGTLLTLYLNQDTGSWTIVSVDPAINAACIRAGGMKSRVIEAVHVGSPS